MWVSTARLLDPNKASRHVFYTAAVPFCPCQAPLQQQGQQRPAHSPASTASAHSAQPASHSPWPPAPEPAREGSTTTCCRKPPPAAAALLPLLPPAGMEAALTPPEALLDLTTPLSYLHSAGQAGKKGQF